MRYMTSGTVLLKSNIVRIIKLKSEYKTKSVIMMRWVPIDRNGCTDLIFKEMMDQLWHRCVSCVKQLLVMGALAVRPRVLLVNVPIKMKMSLIR